MIKQRTPYRGTITAEEITQAYEKAFNVQWWHRYFGLADFKLADQTYAEADLEEINKVLEQDKVDKEKYKTELFDCEVNPATAYGLGLFYADGYCNKHNWKLENTNIQLLQRVQNAFRQEWNDFIFEIKLDNSGKAGYPTNFGTRKKDCYYLTLKLKHNHSNGIRNKFIETFRNTCYFGNLKKVPAGILESPLSSKRAFLQGIIDGDGYEKKHWICTHSKFQVAELVKLMADARWTSSIKKAQGNNNYRIYYGRKKEDKGRILEYLDGKDFTSSTEIRNNLQLNWDSCCKWLRELEREKFIKAERPNMKPKKVKLLGTYQGCDDFSFALFGAFHHNRKTAAMPIFITWVLTPQGGHALLSFYKDEKIQMIEPQTDEIFDLPSDWALILLVG